MPRRTSKGPSSARFVEETLALISERGGSVDVNLREISRRVGCAHTNVYNYFASLDDLLWAAYRQALVIYADAIAAGLSATLPARAYFRRLMSNLFEFGIDHPGLYRFIASDPMQVERIPEDILAIITAMKGFFMEVVATLCAGRLEGAQLENLGNVLLAYLDGESFNLINGRVLPDEDVAARVVDNAELLFTRLTAGSCDGIDLRQAVDGAPPRFPVLEALA